MNNTAVKRLAVDLNAGTVVVTSTTTLSRDVDALHVTSDTAVVASKAIWSSYADAVTLRVVLLNDKGGQPTQVAMVQIGRTTGMALQYDDLKRSADADDKYFFCMADAYSISPQVVIGIKDTGCLTGPAKNDGSTLSSAPIGSGCSVDQPIKATQTKLLYSPEHSAYASVTPSACLASIEAAQPYGYTLPPAAPVAGFSATPLTGIAPLTVRFSSTSTGNIMGYAWDFGDGGTSTDKAPAPHAFAAPGTYLVTLSVTGPGGSGSALWPISVAPPPTPEPPGYSFGGGVKIVGQDLTPGTYRTRTPSGGCYWERLSGFGGTLGDIIANENTSGPEVVTIAPTDVGFNSVRCSRWTKDLSPITPSTASPFGAGTFIVSIDIAAGTWRSAGSGSCYWARLSGFGSGVNDIIANDNTQGSAVVTIGPRDRGFRSSGCGTWSRLP